MCGIVSIIQKDWTKTLSYAAEKAFSTMLFADAVRGNDGTGYFYYSTQQKTVMFQKFGKPSWEAIPMMADLRKLSVNARWIVGHNRKGTTGTISDSTAHPFIWKDITLVHNGTLDNYFTLGYKEDIKVTVDSEIIPHLLDKYKPKEALEMLYGAYALVWHNDKTDRLFLARNKERPLWLVETGDFYAAVSEAELAEWAFTRNGIKVIGKKEVEVGKIYEFLWNKANKLQVIYTKFTPKEKPSFVYQPPQQQQQYQQSLPYIKPTTATRYKGGRFQRDDVILFEVTKSVIKSWCKDMQGYAIDQPEVTVACHASNDVKIGEMYYGTIQTIWWDNGRDTAYVTNVVPADDVLQSANGVLLTDKVIYELDQEKCKSCGRQDLTYDDCFVEIDPSGKPSYYCTECSWNDKCEEMTAYVMGSSDNYLTA